MNGSLMVTKMYSRMTQDSYTWYHAWYCSYVLCNTTRNPLTQHFPP